jgi:hypothetical protein
MYNVTKRKQNKREIRTNEREKLQHVNNNDGDTIEFSNGINRRKKNMIEQNR